jgi:hypothetical protein
MAWVQSSPVTVEFKSGWERALAGAIDEAVMMLARGRDFSGVTTTRIVEYDNVRQGFGKGHEIRTAGVIVTVFGS